MNSCQIGAVTLYIEQPLCAKPAGFSCMVQVAHRERGRVRRRRERERREKEGERERGDRARGEKERGERNGASTYYHIVVKMSFSSPLKWLVHAETTNFTLCVCVQLLHWMCA